ncbi:hypothetical protein BHE90_003694 [Fusarium euwallaceae]|uniref:LPXTG-domain-containing protein n=2 Tax=Fusarium solani species complex TaxID=232080 RepID=A0A3M2SNF9_9HYPO|nr:hypothetical protein CDV36_001151 [Fusarium kuroshium]RTE81791.1 hypothetical protein BHE90_003694 [Fusarium euwallaceae]
MADTLVTSTRSVYDDGPRPVNPQDMATITHGAVFARQIYDDSCVSMIGLFTDCTKRIDDFTELGYREQASCYCCHRSDGTLTWTDELGYYASDCVDWAITGEPDTAYSVAKTFATFCKRFTDVCDASSSSIAINSGDEDPVTVTAKPTNGDTVTVIAKPSSSNSNNEGLSTGAIAGIAVGVGAVVLLVLAGVFLYFKKKRSAARPAAPQPTQVVQPFGDKPQQQPYAVYGNQQPPIQQFSPIQPPQYQGPSPFQPPPAAAPWPLAGQSAGTSGGQEYVAELPIAKG